MAVQLLDLPGEIRSTIWQYALDFGNTHFRHATETEVESEGYKNPASLLCACRGMYEECMPIFFYQNTLQLPLAAAAFPTCSIHSQPLACYCRTSPAERVCSNERYFSRVSCRMHTCMSFWDGSDEAWKLRTLRVAASSLPFLRRLAVQRDSLSKQWGPPQLIATPDRLPDVLLWLRDKARNIEHIRVKFRLHHAQSNELVALGWHSLLVERFGFLVKREKRLFKTLRSFRNLQSTDLYLFGAPEHQVPARPPDIVPDSCGENGEHWLRCVNATFFPRASFIETVAWQAPHEPDPDDFFHRCIHEDTIKNSGTASTHQRWTPSVND